MIITYVIAIVLFNMALCEHREMHRRPFSEIWAEVRNLTPTTTPFSELTSN